MDEKKLCPQFKFLMDKLEKLAALCTEENLPFMSLKFKNNWIDGEEVKYMLGISSRELQTYRDEGVLSYTQISPKKIFYRYSEIVALMEACCKRKKKEVY